jgi:signal peptidase
MSRGLIDRLLPVPAVGLGPSLNLLPPRTSTRSSAWQPTLNLATQQPTLNLATVLSSAEPTHLSAGCWSPRPSGYFLLPPARPTVRRPASASVARWIAAACLWTALGIGAGLLLSLSVPMLFGYRSFVVMSGSMEPAIHTGDVVIDQQIAPAKARVGDVVTYRDPDHPTRLITHRVRAISVNGNRVNFVTQGDANNNSQRWTIPADGTIGVVRFRIVRLGYALVRINTPIGRLFLIIAPILLLGAYEIAAIWRKDEQPKENPGVVWA